MCVCVCICEKRPESKKRSQVAAAQVTRALSVVCRSLLSGLVLCVCMYVCMYVCVYVCMYECVCVCVYMYVFFNMVYCLLHYSGNTTSFTFLVLCTSYTVLH